MSLTLIRHPAAEQLSSVQLREWQRYRGWTVKILEELEHSGGDTTHHISDATGGRCAMTGRILRRMWKCNLVERVERWGWRITRDGLFLLSLSIQDTSRTQQGHNEDTTRTQEKSEPAPPCFHAKTCHIRQICQDKRYTLKNRTLCHSCVWDQPGLRIIPRATVEMKVMGST